VRVQDWRGTKPELIKLIGLGRKRDELEETLFKTYSSGLLSLPLEQTLHTLSKSRNSNFMMAWYQSFRTKLILNKHMKIKTGLSAEMMIRDLGVAVELLDISGRMGKSSALGSLFGNSWNDARPDWNSLQQQVEWLSRFKEILARTETADIDETMQALNFWSSFACEKREIIDASAPLGRAFVLFREKMNAFKSALDGAVVLLQPSPDCALMNPSAPDYFKTIRSSAARWKEGFKELRAWCSYQAACLDSASLGLGKTINMLDSGSCPVELFTRLCEKTFARWSLKEIFSGEQVLARFLGGEHDRKIASFRELDEAIRELTRLTVFAHLTMRLPRQTLDNDRLKSSETGIIKRFVKGARISIRQMFKECPEALARLKPCVLMSPLSVAQYLSPDFPRFDMVVFDEASQMPPWEAIGAIARGNQVIVVGDSKQLPPTVFFEKAASEDDDGPVESKYRDLESILDECQVSHLPVHSLKWHYRSKHESLISFSNEHYYYNELLTFPSAGDKVEGLGVSMRYVDGGYYDASRSRTNRAEAEALVSEIVSRLKDPGRRGYSMGVVTFSVAQQSLIEDLLEEARQGDPEIDPYFTGSVMEPVFIKNLETVQGDERDVILFSICYGPNRDGKVDMRFGPLNNKGGERRLNVAITRARRQLIVFSTLRPDQIDLRRTDAVGVRDLKDFLAFASNNGILRQSPAAQSSKTDLPFEDEVRSMLVARGWAIDTQIGCSGYRIDLAVRHPENKGFYVLGIECDGASYHSARTAGDRDRLRQAVLRSLGWRLIRVWSTDWWLNKDKEIERLDKEIRAAISSFTPEMASCAEDMVNTKQVSASTASPAIVPSLSAPLLIREKIADSNGDGIPDLPGQALYNRAILPACSRKSGFFHDTSSTMEIVGEIGAIMKTEAPISTDLLVSHIAEAWGLPRITAKVEERVLSLAKSQSVRVQKLKDRSFFWRNDQEERLYQGFRVPDPQDAFIRNVEHIPPQEVANAAHEMLKEHLSLNREDLLKGLSRLFGFPRIVPRVRQAIEEGVELYLSGNPENGQIPDGK
jgi:very-short-patch-repair endonuclease